jgi:hypothetical protein
MLNIESLFGRHVSITNIQSNFTSNMFKQWKVVEDVPEISVVTVK